MELETSTLIDTKHIRIEFEDETTFEGRVGIDDYGTYYLIEDTGGTHLNVIQLVDNSGENLAENTYGEIIDLTVLD